MIRRKTEEDSEERREKWWLQAIREGLGFSALTLAKLSRVYQFNCGNMTVISRKELEGKA